MPDSNAHPVAPESARPYVVVARRYRPQRFEELIGQEHVAKALTGAIATGRIGHAYLFTGARGVGKTSAARILAKALNCVEGPTPTPCNRCDVCLSVSAGEDVDVLEIDGASNRGIDEIRTLRQNVGIRPSRARFKIYIIDEVHMLTREAFNALLKTLEEPPEHVKFIFCTTEASKIPITILSRCQRFDFAGIVQGSIATRLQQIVEAEGLQAEPEALEVLARRANGSMRDSQSLLEQLLAVAPGRISAADVHAMLGTANDERLAGVVRAVLTHEPAAALAELDQAVSEGVDVGQFLEQLLGYLRDCMVAVAGRPANALLYASAGAYQAVCDAGQRLGLETILAAMQIVDQALGRMRYSTQGRIIAELAIVRLCRLEDLETLPQLIAQLRGGAALEVPPRISPPIAPAQLPPARMTPPSAGVPARPATDEDVKKKSIVDEGVSPPPKAKPPEPAEAGGSQGDAISIGDPALVWRTALEGLSGMAADQARQAQRVAFHPPNRLVITLPPGYAFQKGFCERPENLTRFERQVAEQTGHSLRIEFSVAAGEPPKPGTASAPKPVSQHQRMMEASQNPMVRRAMELFGAQLVRVDGPSES